MKHRIRSFARPPDNELGGVGGWIATLVVWCVASALCLVIVSWLLSPAE